MPAVWSVFFIAFGTFSGSFASASRASRLRGVEGLFGLRTESRPLFNDQSRYGTGSGFRESHDQLTNKHQADDGGSGFGKADRHIVDERPMLVTGSQLNVDETQVINQSHKKTSGFGHGANAHLDKRRGLGSGSAFGNGGGGVWMANVDQLVSTLGLWVRGPYSGRYDEICQPTAATKEKWASYKKLQNDCSKTRECAQRRALVWKCGSNDFVAGWAITLKASLSRCMLPFRVSGPYTSCGIGSDRMS